jgi:two-component system, cell cycle sensor histidine kinase and response regulator CckA
MYVIKQIYSKLISKQKPRKNIARIVLYIILMMILSSLTYFTYDEYKNTIITQQQQNMLGTARSISRSIELSISEVVDSIKIITFDKEFSKYITEIERVEIKKGYYEKIKSYYEAEGKAINKVSVFDKNGKLITDYPQNILNSNNNLKTDIDLVIARKETYIGRVYFDENSKDFILNIYQPFFEDEKLQGVVSVALSLELIYDRLISPVKIGEKGYAMVKDDDGTIIMHPVKEQVGIDVIESRKQMYPDLDYRELEALIDDQLRGKEGTAIYHSYWWGESVLRRVKKLSAYTPVKLGDHFWVVALTMSYDEIQEPINRFLIKIIGIACLVIIIVYTSVSAFLRLRKSKKELEKETEYLRILNESTEELRKKEAEMYHSHKLKMIGTLAGGIAHDINNLLTPILGYSELLLMRIPQTSEYFEEIEEILKASRKGKDLIEQILSFSRSDNGTVKVEPIDINSVTRETVKLVRAVLPRNIVIRENIQEGCGYINANYTQIHQVIFNLCTNAYQAIKDTKGKIEIALHTISSSQASKIKLPDAERNYVELSVRDTGCGMDEETRTRIFEPFFTTKRIGEGTGLGLFVVQSIVDKYDGLIRVESEIGEGSCFKVYFPMLDEEMELEKSISLKNTKDGSKRILIIDDNKDILDVLKKGLEYLGYEITAETNSLAALKRFEKDYSNFDIVITDYMMPDLKGTELAASLKKIRKSIGVILMTGFMEENEKSINDSEVIDEYISKPIEISELSHLIKKVISNFNDK